MAKKKKTISTQEDLRRRIQSQRATQGYFFGGSYPFFRFG